MFLRLYFLLPDEQQAAKLVQDLETAGIKRKHLHAHARNEEQLGGLPRRTKWQAADAGRFIEDFAWNTDLSIFFVASIGMFITLFLEAYVWSFLLAAIMLITFTVGAYFAILVPRVHLDEFEYALQHGEILLMVDVAETKVADIEHFIERHHPAAVPGGSSWTIDALGI